MPQGTKGRIEAPSTVMEGGTFQITARSGIRTVTVAIPGRGATDVTVRNGVAEFTVPPGVPGGTIIIVTDNKLPRPSTTRVTVTGSN